MLQKPSLQFIFGQHEINFLQKKNDFVISMTIKTAKIILSFNIKL